MKINCLILIGFLCIACKSDHKPSLSNIVNVRLEGEPGLLNPILTTAAHTKQVEWQLFMPLLQYDSETLDLYPVLAAARPEVETIEAGPLKGGRKYTFEIRPEAKWDNGQAVLPSDFIFTLKIFLHPKIAHPGLRAFLSFIKAVEIDPTNPRKFTVSTYPAMNLAEEVIGTMAIYPEYHYDPLGQMASHDLAAVLDQESFSTRLEQDSSLQKFATNFQVQGGTNDENKPIGCGPYFLKEWLPGQRIVLEKKSAWWAGDIKEQHQSFANHPQTLIYQFVQDGKALSALLMEEKIDVAAAIAPSDFEELRKRQTTQAQYQFYNPISSSYYFIAFNMNDPRLSRKESRRAISHLVDVQKNISLAMQGYAMPIIGPILPSKAYYHPGLSPIEFDLAKAKALLLEAGWRDEDQNGILEQQIDGEQVEFSIRFKYAVNNPIGEEVGLLLKDNAIKAGINIELIPLEGGKLIQDTRSRDFELYLSRWSQRPGLDDLRSIWHTINDTPRGFNKTGFGNAITDGLIDSINVEMNEAKRTQMYHHIQEIIYDEQPYVFLFTPTERIVIHKRFAAKAINLRPGFVENTFRLKE